MCCVLPSARPFFLPSCPPTRAATYLANTAAGREEADRYVVCWVGREGHTQSFKLWTRKIQSLNFGSCVRIRECFDDVESSPCRCLGFPLPIDGTHDDTGGTVRMRVLRAPSALRYTYNGKRHSHSLFLPPLSPPLLSLTPPSFLKSQTITQYEIQFHLHCSIGAIVHRGRGRALFGRASAPYATGGRRRTTDWCGRRRTTDW